MRYGRQRSGLTLYTFLHAVTVQFVGRLVHDEIRGPGARWAQGGPVAGSTSAETATDVGGRTFGEKEEKEKEKEEYAEKSSEGGRVGKQGRRVPRASHTINHRGNSIDGSLLLEGASDACQTYLVRRTICEKAAFVSIAFRAVAISYLNDCVIIKAIGFFTICR